MSFSERMGYKPARNVLQIDDIDEPLRIALYNLLYKGTSQLWFYGSNYGVGYNIAKVIWTEFFRRPIDTFTNLPQHFANELKEFVESRYWYEVYDLLSFTPRLQTSASRMSTGCLSAICQATGFAMKK